MKSRLVVWLAVLLLAVVAMPGLAEAQGYNVRRDATVQNVPQYANNAIVNVLIFMRTDSDEPDIADAPDGESLTIKIGYGLLITNDDSVRDKASADFPILCDSDGDGNIDGYCQETSPEASPSATISNEGGAGVVTITIPEDDAANQSFWVFGVRVDASALDAEERIIAAVTSTTDATTVGLGGASSDGSVSGAVGVVTPGLQVTATKDTDLACSAVTPAPSITIAEAYTPAWGPANLTAHLPTRNQQSPSVKIVLDNLPGDAKVEWPASVNSTINVAPSGEDEDLQVNGTLTLDAAESSSNGKEVVYDHTRVTSYKVDDPNDTDPSDGTDQIDRGFAREHIAPRSFKIVPSKTTFMGDASINISAQLWPPARRGTDGQKLNLDSELSFEHPLQAPEKGNGEGWLVVSECVTYLLYPFVTCGATPGWSTGIAVSNTSADANVFGAFDETSQQHGSVVIYGFPKERILSAVEDEDEDPMVEPVVSTISDQLMAGETMTFDCGTTTMAGMEGYAIVRAGFQHARGMAFVLGNFEDGAGWMCRTATWPRSSLIRQRGVRIFSPYSSPGGVKMAQEYSLQRVLGSEERSGRDG